MTRSPVAGQAAGVAGVAVDDPATAFPNPT